MFTIRYRLCARHCPQRLSVTFSHLVPQNPWESGSITLPTLCTRLRTTQSLSKVTQQVQGREPSALSPKSRLQPRAHLSAASCTESVLHLKMPMGAQEC